MLMCPLHCMTAHARQVGLPHWTRNLWPLPPTVTPLPLAVLLSTNIQYPILQNYQFHNHQTVCASMHTAELAHEVQTHC